MPILVRNLTLPLDGATEDVLPAAARRLRLPVDAVRAYAVVHRSLDARKNRPLCWNYHVELALHDPPRREKALVQRLHRPDVRIIEPDETREPTPGHEPLPGRPTVIGFGPGGMFAALRLAEYGYRPLVLERGRDVRRRHYDILKRFIRDRVFNPESNYLYGEGGAGAYSDGKLYTRVSDPLVRTVLEILYQHGADPDILIDARPHIGSDRLPTICRHLREHIERLGGEVRFDARVDDVIIEDDALIGLRVNAEDTPAGPTILAVGHSARDTIRMLAARGVTIAPKPFQIGVRIEHPQSLVDRWQYGELCGDERLPAAEYHLVAKGAAGEQGDLFSFCMCPGGLILPTNESPNLIATNGASRSRRGGPFANAGLVITVNPGATAEDALAGLAYQEALEARAFDLAGGDYRAPAQRAADFLADRLSDGQAQTSYPFGLSWCDLNALMPENVRAALRKGLALLERSLPGFAGAEGIMLAPETRASAPVRILRDKASREAVATRRLYPVGEGAGYAGGIVSAAIDGIKTADAIIARYSPKA